MRTSEDTGRLRICSGYTVVDYFDIDRDDYTVKAIIEAVSKAAEEIPKVKKAISCVGAIDNMILICKAELNRVGKDGDSIIKSIGLDNVAGMCYLPSAESSDIASKIISEYRGIYISRKVTQDITGYEARLKESIAKGWISAGSGDIRQAVAHEVGHAIDYVLNLSSSEIINKLYEDNMYSVSTYASCNIGEFIAECYAEYTTGDKPRDIAIEVIKAMLAHR